MENRAARVPLGISDRISLVIATGLGSGYSPVAPGTCGSFLGILLILLLSRLEVSGGPRLVLFLVVVSCISAAGIWAASRAAKLFQRRDPPQVVIDEIVGQLLTFGLIFRHPRFLLLLIGFLLFRFFDIVKPFPIRRLEKAPLGFGIVLDDLAAGFYASLALLLLDVWWPSLTPGGN
jgi:phosphatidylglycerophosphatase A